jgi:hypothetical protein
MLSFKSAVETMIHLCFHLRLCPNWYAWEDARVLGFPWWPTAFKSSAIRRVVQWLSAYGMTSTWNCLKDYVQNRASIEMAQWNFHILGPWEDRITKLCDRGCFKMEWCSSLLAGSFPECVSFGWKEDLAALFFLGQFHLRMVKFQGHGCLPCKGWSRLRISFARRVNFESWAGERHVTSS